MKTTSNIYIDEILYNNFNQLGIQHDVVRNKIYQLYNFAIEIDPRPEFKIGYAIGITLKVLNEYSIDVSEWKAYTTKEELSKFDTMISQIVDKGDKSMVFQRVTTLEKKARSLAERTSIQMKKLKKTRKQKLVI